MVVDSEFQEELLGSGIIQQVNNIFEKLSPSKPTEDILESFQFVILDFSK